ncbi:V-type ATP synthase subunit A [Spirilliplanes yamanashiensis]|uniref:V-type ATP synthase alpha chain n=1 Tax=Spirilliplanes yamanashiensis TaxID=42233 RepID=A0A8J3YFF0_9ACTN|nr:V-type ATP synthase subunit A [Spirilliplanes yamanashiensis]MDP9818274.1 V/A-type H+-transporting ATPase subunit A [Spirilliplanes yamanashiensis]GIJ06692.1 V-type ATP synthase alpha chain [Spirilliplanes yamanashiensis]
MTASTVTRVDGPLVEVTHGGRMAMFDLVELGPARLPGEVVAIRDGLATVQAYEYTGGLRPGDPVRGEGTPLTARLGPGLLGAVFDGLLRPLSGGPVWLVPGSSAAGADGRSWPFTPAVRPGQGVAAGDLLGTVPGPGAVDYRILVPPGAGGRVGAVAPAGPLTGTGVVATVGGTPVPLCARWPVRRPRPCRRRVPAGTPLHTGQRVLDLLFPVLKGSTVAVPGGFGTGKTMLLQQIAKWCDADVIVYAGCGERGNEMADVVADLFALPDPRTGGLLADRTVAIANTSNMPMMAREASVHTAVTVAEYFRDMGRDVLVIADSTSRWAEALREFAARNGALPAEEGYPADLASALAAFYERAGAVDTLGGLRGSVTIVGAVSPPGGDLTEPVTAHTQRFTRNLWTLDRELAYARHYPAVSWAASFSQDAGAAAAWHGRNNDGAWVVRRARALTLLAEADRLAALADLVGLGGLAPAERVSVHTARLLRDAVLRQSALSANDASCGPAKGAALVEAVLTVGDAARRLVDRGADPARIDAVDTGPLVRARDAAGAEDTAAVAAARDAVLTALEATT